MRRQSARSFVTSTVLSSVVVTSATSALAATTVEPANGGYQWSTTYEESGGAKELVSFTVKKHKTATFSTLRGICHGDYGVLATFGADDGLASIKNAKVKKSKEVTLNGETATVTVFVAWPSAKKARGWIKVSGQWAGATCDAPRSKFKLTFTK